MGRKKLSYRSLSPEERKTIHITLTPDEIKLAKDFNKGATKFEG